VGEWRLDENYTAFLALNLDTGQTGTSLFEGSTRASAAAPSAIPDEWFPLTELNLEFSLSGPASASGDSRSKAAVDNVLVVRGSLRPDFTLP